MPKPLKLIFLVFTLIVITLIISLWCFGVQYRWMGFWALASFVSFLHAIPGWAYGLFSFSGAVKNHQDRTEWFNTVFVDGKASPFWTKVYALPQALTYFMSSLAGFASLFIILKILRNDLSGMTDITSSKAALLIALFFFCIAGLSGALGRILTELKGLPGISGS